MSPPLSKLPASQLRGLSGAGSESNDSTAWHTEPRVHAGDQAFFNMSRQISPVCKEADGVVSQSCGARAPCCAASYEPNLYKKILEKIMLR